MKKLYTFFLSLISLSLFAQSYSAPESVEYDAANGRYLVACNGSTNSIQQVIPGNAPTLFTSNVSGPYGIEILGSKLWVCDGTRIKSYNLTTAALVDNINITGASFLNGITSDGGHFLFVSDYSAKKIYRINTNTLAFYTMVSNTVTSPNGMWYDGANNRVLFVNWGSNAPVKAISLADSAVTTVTTTTQTNCDGIARDAAGNYFISSWNPQAVYKYNSSFASLGSVVSGLSNAADIFYNTSNDTIAVPNSNNNTVTFHYLGTPVSVEEEKGNTSLSVFPNPVDENTVFQYTLPESSQVQLKVFSADGKYANVLLNEIQQAGEYRIPFKGDGLAAGQYFYSLQTAKDTFSGTLILKGQE